MNEKMKYAEMIEIPVSTSNITFKQPKKRKKQKEVKEDVKDLLIDKINVQNQDGNIITEKPALAEGEEFTTSNIKKGKTKKSVKFNLVTVELCVIGLLILTIFLTSAIIPTSGINSFFKSAFSNVNDSKIIDDRTFEDFAPTFAYALDGETQNDTAVISIKGQSSVYSPCDGKVSNVIQGEDGLFSVEISHSDNFKTLFGNLNYCYVNVGEDVYKTIPIGFSRDCDVSVCFIDGENNVITDKVYTACSAIWNQ